MVFNFFLKLRLFQPDALTEEVALRAIFLESYRVHFFQITTHTGT
jgi:hypothetical protein